MGNLAHGTLGHAMAPQAMWLNIQMPVTSQVGIRYTQCSMLNYFIIRGVHVGWKGNIDLSTG